MTTTLLSRVVVHKGYEVLTESKECVWGVVSRKAGPQRDDSHLVPGAHGHLAHHSQGN